MEVRHHNMGTINQNRVSISTDKGYIELYFSYETIVAVNNTVSQNEWSVTTGKLLNRLQRDKSQRVPHSEVLAEVERSLQAIMPGSDCQRCKSRSIKQQELANIERLDKQLRP